MDPIALQQAGRLGGTLLQAAGAPPLVIAERLARHGAPLVLVLGADPGVLEPVLEIAGTLQLDGLELNLLAVLDPGPGLGVALQVHRRRIGSLLCALQAAPPWGGGPPMLAKRLPGRVRAGAPLPLRPARLSPLEQGQLRAQDPAWTPARLQEVFTEPRWEAGPDGWTARWWPGVELPPGAEILCPSLELAAATPLVEALRAALRSTPGRPVPLLPVDGDPAALLALAGLDVEVQAFDGGPEAWGSALRQLARLPAPPHFCARC